MMRPGYPSQSRGLGGVPQKLVDRSFMEQSSRNRHEISKVPIRGTEKWKEWQEVQDAEREILIMVTEAIDSQAKHQLNDAERLFQRALVIIESSNFKNKDKLFVECLSGLGSVFLRRGRSLMYDEMEWHRMMMQSLSLHQQALTICAELEELHEDLSEEEKKKWSWVDDYKMKSTQDIRVIDKVMLTSIKDRIAVTEGRNPTDKISEASVYLDTGWLDRFESYIHENSNNVHQNGISEDQNDEEETESVSSGNSDDTSKDWLSRRVQKIDCDKIQKTIMKLVKQISSDMRERFIRKKLSEKMFRETVSNQMIAKFGLMEETNDILALFENAIIQYKYGVTPEEFNEWNIETSDIESEKDGNETCSTDTLSDDASQTVPLAYSPGCEGMEKIDESGFEEFSYEEDSYKMPGIITIWRAYGKQGAQKKRLPHTRPYLLQGFEEKSPLTETILSSDVNSLQEASSCVSIVDIIPPPPSPSSPTSPTEPPVNFLKEHHLKHALALSLIRCAQHLQKEPQARNQACELYKHALGIIREGPSDLKGRQDLMADILKNVGAIRCSQGEVGIGSQLMHEAMELYSPDNDVDNVNVAEVWYMLGEAYIKEEWKESSILQHVIKLVKDEVDHEILQQECGYDEDGPPDDASVVSDDSDGEESYSVCAYEAICCYKSALSILSLLRRRKEHHTSLYVDVLTRLADASIVVQEYERAVLCYEEALFLCQNTLGSVSLTNSAHILTMLGTTNFLLGTYSKAASMFETAHILNQHLYGVEDNFEYAFSLSMLGLNYYLMKYYSKCVGWCTRAFEIYSNIFKQEIIFIEPLHRWIIAQTLFSLGYAYSTIDNHDKALHNLKLSKNLIEKSREEDRNISQLLKTTKVMADVYSAIDDHESALQYYQEALNYSFTLGDDHNATTLQNQLLNKMASIHVSTKQYNSAAEYLEQALDCQRNVESNIKGDFIGVLYQLGMTYTLSGDIDRAIECFNECHEAYEEAQVTPNIDTARPLGQLGTLYHLKGCMQDDNDDMMEYLDSADQYYRSATDMDKHSVVSVQYANFLYQQEQYAEALLVMLPYVFSPQLPNSEEIHYNGPEQAVLPEHLLYDLDHIDEVTMETRIFARFLGILCLKQLALYEDAEDCLVSMVSLVYRSEDSLNHTLLGYSLLEMGMYLEAADAFNAAASWQHESDISVVNYWLSILLWVYHTLSQGIYYTWEYTTEAYVDLHGPAPTPTPPPFISLTSGWTSDFKYLRDSGYFGHSEEKISETEHKAQTVVSTVDEVFSPITEVSPNTEVANEDSHVSESTQEESFQEWHMEEVQETPLYILEAILRSQQSLCEQEEITSPSYFDYDKRSKTSHDRTSWTAEKEVSLEMPSAITEAITSHQKIDDSRYTSRNRYERDEFVHKPISDYRSMYSDRYSYKEEVKEPEDEWVTVEETVTTPIEMLHALRNNNQEDWNSNTNSRFDFQQNQDSNGNGTDMKTHSSSRISTGYSQDFSDEHSSSRTWTSHQDRWNANSRRTNYQELNANQVEKEEEEDCWITTEETVETHPAILQAIMASQNKF